MEKLLKFYRHSISSVVFCGLMSFGEVVFASSVLKELAIELADIPAGSFMMGSNNGDDSEKPVHRVTVPAFKMMKHEVTWAQYQTCIDAGACSTESGGVEGEGKGVHPVIYVSWNDTQKFIQWLNQKTGMNFRLPSEAEWEYAARAGSSTKYSWGNSPSGLHANGENRFGMWPSDGYDNKIAPVGSFQPNEFGLYDMHGNVWEWSQDCWNDSYLGAPSNGAPWESGKCYWGAIRGGSYGHGAMGLRSANRTGDIKSSRSKNIGFRLVQSR